MLQSRLECCICCKCFRGMLQASVQSVSSVSDICCKRFDLDVAYVSHICCKSMFQIFQLFCSYVAVSIFMLQVFYLDVVYVSHTYCMFMFQMFHQRLMLHSSVSYCKCFVFQRYICSESHGGTASAWRKGRGETGAGRWGARRAWVL